MPAFCLFLGALMFGAFAIGDNLGQGAFSFAVMAALGAVFAFGRRSETLQGLGGPARDERFEMIDLRATAFTGAVLIVCIIGGFLLRGRPRPGRQPVVAARRDRRRGLRPRHRRPAQAP